MKEKIQEKKDCRHRNKQEQEETIRTRKANGRKQEGIKLSSGEQKEWDKIKGKELRQDEKM